ncbi:MAG TPA: SRPBCC family protein [Limnobacter sp.]|nr:SRPBCC family protein [Limnobacter sp.]
MLTHAPLMIQHSCRIPVALQDCFYLYTRLKPQEYIHSDALIAPITGVEMIKGHSFNEVGDIQQITFKGGAVIQEEVLAFVPNRQFVYRGTGFSQPLLNWLDHAKGSFEFEKDGDGTLVTWRYLFYLKPGFGLAARQAVFKKVIVDFIWQRMMTKTLANLTQIITLRAMQVQRKA